MKRQWRIAAVACVGAVLAGGAALAVTAFRRDMATPVALGDVDYVQSATCRRCHEGRYESWHRTFHRTMTQEATPASVLGNFEGVSYAYEGVTSRFTREGDRYFMETVGPTGAMERLPVVRTVGSRRVQQYVTRVGDRHIRLPMAWNIGERRWFHLNGGFLHPDGSNFSAHTSLWDANCIFCHNVKARPGYDWERQTFDSSVAELGIACEACHGPGEEHIARNSSPLRRYLLHYSEARDPTIVSPAELTKERSVQICGHCHGQRLPNPPDRIREFVSAGDPYTAGDDLNAHVTPMWRDTKLAGVDLAKRFWRDGTPRLTAYEYQGLLMSKDYQKGELTCISCHEMHGGDPKGMIEEEKRGPAACADCHADIVRNAAKHSRHEARGSGSDCYGCHMPKIAYGLLDVHPTHHIQVPDPTRAWRFDMPEACTLCHTDRSARWAAAELAKQRGELAGAGVASSPDALAASPPLGRGFEIAESVRAIAAGDVVQRSVAVMSLADERSYTNDPRERLWAVPFLLRVMERDDYPAVRHFAARGLRRLAEAAGAPAAALPFFDPQAPAEERARVIARWRAWWDSERPRVPHPGEEVPLDAALVPDEELLTGLERLRDPAIISIGE